MAPIKINYWNTVEGRTAGDMDTAGRSMYRLRNQKTVLKPREEHPDQHSVRFPRIVGCYGIGVYSV